MNSGKRKPACSGIGANSDGTGSRLGIVHLCPGRKGFPGYTGQSMGNPGPWSESSSPPCPLLHAPPRKERVSGSGSHLHGELGHHGGALVRGGLQVQLPTHVDRPLPHDRQPQGALPGNLGNRLFQDETAAVPAPPGLSRPWKVAAPTPYSRGVLVHDSSLVDPRASSNLSRWSRIASEGLPKNPGIMVRRRAGRASRQELRAVLE